MNLRKAEKGEKITKRKQERALLVGHLPIIFVIFTKILRVVSKKVVQQSGGSVEDEKNRERGQFLVTGVAMCGRYCMTILYCGLGLTEDNVIKCIPSNGCYLRGFSNIGIEFYEVGMGHWRTLL